MLWTSNALDTWVDPHPLPEVQRLADSTVVVRDDHLPGGTKRRALDYLIGHAPEHRHVEEWVYGASPAWGYAQWALALTCRQYQKRAVLFMADRAVTTRHRVQLAALEAGAHYEWVPNGMLSVTKKRAADYVAASPQTRRLLPMGGDTPESVAALARRMQDLRATLPWEPTDIWSVISSGTLSRALQTAFPESTVHGVVVGHQPSPDAAGQAVLYASPYAFKTPIRPTEAPPYPSMPEYDAKLWPFYTAWRVTHPESRVLLWNVGV